MNLLILFSATGRSPLTEVSTLKWQHIGDNSLTAVLCTGEETETEKAYLTTRRSQSHLRMTPTLAEGKTTS